MRPIDYSSIVVELVESKSSPIQLNMHSVKEPKHLFIKPIKSTTACSHIYNTPVKLSTTAINQKITTVTLVSTDLKEAIKWLVLAKQ